MHVVAVCRRMEEGVWPSWSWMAVKLFEAKKKKTAWRFFGDYFFAASNFCHTKNPYQKNTTKILVAFWVAFW